MSEVLRRNFDEERKERYEQRYTFQIGGEVFAYKVGLRPETFNEFVSEYEKVTVGMDGDEVLRIYDETLIRFLSEEDGEARWRALREREEEALTGRDIHDVLLFIFSEQTGRPTQAPAPSGNGRETTGKSSTARSSSRRAALAASSG